MSRIYGIDSAFGGSDFYDENGNHVGYSVPGIGGGEDYYWDNGETGYTVDSIIGNGKNYYGSDGTRASPFCQVTNSVESTLFSSESSPE